MMQFIKPIMQVVNRIKPTLVFGFLMIFLSLIYLKIINNNVFENIYLSSITSNITLQFLIIISILLIIILLLYKIHKALYLFFSMYLVRYLYKSLFMDINQFNCLGFKSKQKVELGQVLINKNKEISVFSEINKPKTQSWFEFLNHIDYSLVAKVGGALVVVAGIVYLIYEILNTRNGGTFCGYHFFNNNGNNGGGGVQVNGSPTVPSSEPVIVVPVTTKTNPSPVVEVPSQIKVNEEPSVPVIESPEVPVIESPVDNALPASADVVSEDSKFILESKEDTDKLVDDFLLNEGLNENQNNNLEGEYELGYESESSLSETSIMVENEIAKLEPDITILRNFQEYLIENNLLDKCNIAQAQKKMDYDAATVLMDNAATQYGGILHIIKSDPNIKQLFPEQRKEYLSFLKYKCSDYIEEGITICKELNPDSNIVLIEKIHKYATCCVDLISENYSFFEENLTSENKEKLKMIKFLGNKYRD